MEDEETFIGQRKSSGEQMMPGNPIGRRRQQTVLLWVDLGHHTPQFYSRRLEMESDSKERVKGGVEQKGHCSLGVIDRVAIPLCLCSCLWNVLQGQKGHYSWGCLDRPIIPLSVFAAASGMFCRFQKLCQETLSPVCRLLS